MAKTKFVSVKPDSIIEAPESIYVFQFPAPESTSRLRKFKSSTIRALWTIPCPANTLISLTFLHESISSLISCFQAKLSVIACLIYKFFRMFSLTPVFSSSSENFSLLSIVNELTQALLFGLHHVGKLISCGHYTSLGPTWSQFRLIAFAGRHFYHSYLRFITTGYCLISWKQQLNYQMNTNWDLCENLLFH